MSTIPASKGVLPFLIMRDANAAIDLLQRVLDAELIWRNDGPDGRVWVAGLRVNEGLLLLSDEFPEFGLVSPDTIGAPSVTLHVYVDDVEEAVGRAIAEGMEAPYGVKEMPWGDDYAHLNDDSGHRWAFATRKTDYSAAELSAEEDKFMTEYRREIELAEQYAKEWHAEHPHAKMPNVPPDRD